MSLIDERSATTESAPRRVPAEPEEGRAADPNGGIAAAVLAAGIGCMAFGVLVVLTEASASVEEAMTVSEGAGPLSGKGLGATVLWAVAWLVLHGMLRHREVSWRPVARTTTALIAIGLVGTFPPVFQLFAH